MEGREEVGRVLEVSCGDTPEVFEAIEEPLDAVALSVDLAVHRPDDAYIGLAGDMGGCARSLDGRDHCPAEVTSVADTITGEAEGTDKLGRRRLVGRLPGGDEQPHGLAAPVHDGMDLRRQTPSRPTDGVIRAPLFAAGGVLVGAHDRAVYQV